MENSISKLLLLLFLFSLAIPVTAQKFKYKKKTSKYVFKPENGKLNYDLQFDTIDYSYFGLWKVKNEKGWGVIDEK